MLIGFLFVFVTGFMVLIDAKRLGVRPGLLPGAWDMGPWSWFMACLLLWIVVFPMYLVKRGEYVKVLSEKGELQSPRGLGLGGIAVFSVFGFFLGYTYTSILPALLAEEKQASHQQENASAVSSSPLNNPVDGYKDIKFGISYRQLKSMKKCTLPPNPSEADEGVEAAQCQDFPLNQRNRVATFYFVNGKLMRIAVMVGSTTDDFQAYTRSLNEKYGAPSLLDPGTLAAFDNGQIDTADIAWKSNSVALRITRQGGLGAVMLLYSDRNFELAVQENKTKGADKDL